MGLEYIAVSGLTIDHSSGSLVSDGAFTVTSLPSIKVKVSDNGVYNGVYSGVLTFTFTGGSHSAGQEGTATGGGSISITAKKTKADNKLVFRVKDKGTITGVYVPISGNPPIVPFTSDVEITDAGQIKAKGN